MKKLLPLLLAVVLVVACAASCFTASAEDEITVEGITFSSTVADVVVESVRGGAADNTVLIDGDLHEAPSSFDENGIVLIMNTKTNADPKEYPTFSYVLELSEKAEISAFSFGLYVDINSMIGAPEAVTVEYCDDGDTWELCGDFDIELEGYAMDEQATCTKIVTFNFEKELDTVITGKYVRFTFAFCDAPEWYTEKHVFEWFGFTELGVTANEITIIDDSSEESSDESSEESSEESSDESSEESSEAPAPTTENLAAGKTYTFKGAADSGDWADNGTMLTDGVIATAAGTGCAGINNGSAFFLENGYGEVVVDLSEAKDFNSVVVTFFKEASWGVCPPAAVEIYGSNDGTTFTKIGDCVVPADVETDKIPVEYALDLDTAANYRYVSVRVTETNAGWTFLTEVAVNAPVTTPPTGDAGFIALAVIAVIAAAGVVVAKKR